MIHEISVELQTELRVLGVPFPIVDGPEATKPVGWGRERIVVEYDVDGTDSFARPRTTSANPKRRYLSLEACKVTIYAQSPSAGATVFEHRRRAKSIRDRVVVALEIVAAKRKNAYQPSRGRFIVPVDLEGAEIPGGAAYELAFGFERAIETRKWTGEKQPEGNITDVGSTTKVFRPGGAGAGDTACGA